MCVLRAGPAPGVANSPYICGVHAHTALYCCCYCLQHCQSHCCRKLPLLLLLTPCYDCRRGATAATCVVAQGTPPPLRPSPLWWVSSSCWPCWPLSPLPGLQGNCHYRVGLLAVWAWRPERSTTPLKPPKPHRRPTWCVVMNHITTPTAHHRITSHHIISQHMQVCTCYCCQAGSLLQAYCDMLAYL